jgi:predicted nucleic acid-binding protein
MLYFDTSCIVRLYTRDPGWEAVRNLAAGENIACCLHGRAEAVAALHRKFREGAVNKRELQVLLAAFEADCLSGAFDWLPLSPPVVERVAKTYADLPATIQLRAADALHLACAAENLFAAVHSNDVRFLAAAIHFGLNPVNIL